MGNSEQACKAEDSPVTLAFLQRPPQLRGKRQNDGNFRVYINICSERESRSGAGSYARMGLLQTGMSASRVKTFRYPRLEDSYGCGTNLPRCSRRELGIGQRKPGTVEIKRLRSYTHR